MGKPGTAAAQRPPRGHPPPNPILFPGPFSTEPARAQQRPPSPWRTSMEKAGPRRAPTRGGLAASQHRHRAHPRRLQLAGHREGGEQGHKARLLHWPAAAADVDCDAGLSNGFAAAGIDVQEHLADWAAEGGGGHGWMARNTESAPRRRGRARASPQRGRQRSNRRGLACVSPGAAVVVRALLVEGARHTRGWIRLLLLPPQGVLLSGELLAETHGSRCRFAVASSQR